MKKLMRTLIGAASLATAAALASEAVNRILISEALDRREPSVMLRFKPFLAGSDHKSEQKKARDRAAGVLAASDTESVEIIAADGTRLVGHIRRAQNPKRIVLAMHGWRSSWTKEYGVMADFFLREDCTVVYPEQRGQGKSGGDHMSYGMIERTDCHDWLRFISEHVSAELPVYLFGVSMGASTVLMASGLHLPENVRGIVADCGFTSPKAIWRHVVEDNLHLRYAHRASRVDSLCRRRIGLDSDSVTTIDAMKKNTTPILFIHGFDDTFVPLRMTLENYNACRAPKRLLIVEGADHAMSYLTDPKAYEQTVNDFWNTFK